MTYSNRPTASTWQHDNLFGVSNDSVVFDKINPFTPGNLPGAWSAPYSYTKPSAPAVEEKQTPSNRASSPACEYASTAGDNTVAWCNPTKPNCPMSRPWLPERLIDPGMWTYNTDKESSDNNHTMDFKMLIIICVLTLAFLAWRRYT